MVRRSKRFVVAVGAVALMAAACGSSSKKAASTGAAGATASTVSSAANTASDKGVTPTSITIGLITSTTGAASSTFADTAEGVQARFALENSKGGVNGRKLNLVEVDDASSPTQDLTAAQDVVESKGAFGVLGYSAFLFGGFRYLQENGVPVTGSGFDGPEWSTQPNTNMFSFSVNQNPKFPAYTTDADFFKSIGVSCAGGVAYGASPSSTNSIKQMQLAVKNAGLKACYTNLSFPFGGVDFGATSLAMKQAGVDVAVCSCVEASDLAMAIGLKNVGSAAKVVDYTGYSQSTIDDPASAAAAQNAYFKTSYVPFELHQPGGDAMIAALKQFDTKYKGGDPDFGLAGGWTSADLMIKGLQVAGQNPTRQSFIANLSKVTDYDAGGLLAQKWTFANFGQPPDTVCDYYPQLQGTKFVPSKNFCGTPIAGSASS